MSVRRQVFSYNDSLRSKALIAATTRWCEDRDIKIDLQTTRNSSEETIHSLAMHISAKRFQELLDYLKAIQVRDSLE